MLCLLTSSYTFSRLCKKNDFQFMYVWPISRGRFITTSNIFFFFFIYVTRPANLIINHTSISSPGFSHTFITDIYYRDRYHCLWVYVTDFPKTSSAVYNLCRPLNPIWCWFLIQRKTEHGNYSVLCHSPAG